MIKRQQEARQRIPESQIWFWLMQLVYALYECHKRKDGRVILHRDIKPSNIFLNDKNMIKLGDFGFSKTISGASQYAQTMLGTY